MKNALSGKKRATVGYILRRILVMGFRAAPPLLIAFLLIDILNGILSALMTYSTQHLFDVMIGYDHFTPQVIGGLTLFAVMIIGQHGINGLGHTLIPNLKNKMDAKAMQELHEKAGKMPAILFEKQDFLNHVKKATEGTEYSFKMLVPFLRGIFLYGVYMIVIGIYMYSLEPILLLSFVFIIVPTILSSWLKSGLYGKLVDRAAPIQRERDYYKSCIVSAEYHKETRTLGGFGYFIDKFKGVMEVLLRETWETEKKANFMELSSKLVILAGYGGVLCLLIANLLSGDIRISEFSAVFSSLGYMFMMMDEGLRHFLQAPMEGYATVRHFVTFLDMEEPQEPDQEIDFGQEGACVEFKDVSFQYPDASLPALKHIHLRIKKGEIIAVVGRNGAGKTTLTRLLLGIYQPTEGTVSIAGVDTKSVSRRSLYKGSSAVFQNFQRYKMSLEENVDISDPLSQEIPDRERTLQVLQKSGVDYTHAHFPDGLGTMLSRDFDGVDLSGGQWQRIGIARGIYKDHHIVVLDEPTAAIDPKEEYALYHKFREISQGKTCVLVTHRLGAARIADRIILLKDGEIVEAGSHEELLEQDGCYRQMYESQRKWYM